MFIDKKYACRHLIWWRELLTGTKCSPYWLSRPNESLGLVKRDMVPQTSEITVFEIIIFIVIGLAVCLGSICSYLYKKRPSTQWIDDRGRLIDEIHI